MYVFGSVKDGGGGELIKRIVFGLYQSCGNRGSAGRVCGLWWCGMYSWGMGRCYVWVSGIFVYSAGQGICILC